MGNVSTVRFHTFDDRNQLAQALAKEVAALIPAQGPASIAVTGGTTPQPFFAALKPLLENRQLSVTLSDERWVSPNGDASNEKLVREHLLTPAMHFIPLKSEGALEEGALTTEKRLAALKLPFSAVILGMGEDGHVASLFPHHPALAAGLDRCGARRSLPVTDAPKPPAERISLTYSCLIDSKAVFLHITGKAKREALERAMQPGPATEFPVRAFLQQTSVPVAVYWAP